MNQHLGPIAESMRYPAGSPNQYDTICFTFVLIINCVHKKMQKKIYIKKIYIYIY